MRVIYYFRFHTILHWAFTQNLRWWKVVIIRIVCTYLLLVFTPWEFFISVLADGLSLEFEWEQVSSNLQESSQYSSRSQQCCCLDYRCSSSYFQVPQSLCQSFGECPKSTNYNRYNRHFPVPQFISIPYQGLETYPSFRFLSILLCGQLGQRSSQSCKFSLFYWLW